MSSLFREKEEKSRNNGSSSSYGDRDKTTTSPHRRKRCSPSSAQEMDDIRKSPRRSCFHGTNHPDSESQDRRRRRDIDRGCEEDCQTPNHGNNGPRRSPQRFSSFHGENRMMDHHDRKPCSEHGGKKYDESRSERADGHQRRSPDERNPTSNSKSQSSKTRSSTRSAVKKWYCKAKVKGYEEYYDMPRYKSCFFLAYNDLLNSNCIYVCFRKRSEEAEKFLIPLRKVKNLETDERFMRLSIDHSSKHEERILILDFDTQSEMNEVNAFVDKVEKTLPRLPKWKYVVEEIKRQNKGKEYPFEESEMQFIRTYGSSHRRKREREIETKSKYFASPAQSDARDVKAPNNTETVPLKSILKNGRKKKKKKLTSVLTLDEDSGDEKSTPTTEATPPLKKSRTNGARYDKTPSRNQENGNSLGSPRTSSPGRQEVPGLSASTPDTKESRRNGRSSSVSSLEPWKQCLERNQETPRLSPHRLESRNQNSTSALHSRDDRANRLNSESLVWTSTTQNPRSPSYSAVKLRYPNSTRVFTTPINQHPSRRMVQTTLPIVPSMNSASPLILNQTQVPYSMTPPLFSGTTPPRQVGRETSNGGLRNSGNSCYANAVLQQLTQFRAFVDDLNRAKHGSEMVDALCETASYIWKARLGANSNGTVHDASKVKNLVAQRKTDTNYDSPVQQDSHEFFQHCLDVLEGELGKKFIQTHFGSTVESVLRCNKCEYEHKSESTFVDFSLIMPKNNDGKQVQKLDELLKNFFAKEDLAYRCEKCNADNGAERTSSLTSPPNILVLHVKRFHFDEGRFRKRTDRVLAPEKLTLANRLYTLRGVIFHMGNTLERGHYQAAVDNGSPEIMKYVSRELKLRNSNPTTSMVGNGKWTLYNDSLVRETLADYVLDNEKSQRNSYLFFYSQVLNTKQV